MAIIIGGEKAYLTRQIGQFIVSYQWLNKEPAMFIARAMGSMGNKPTAVVKLEDAHRYVDQNHLIVYSYQVAEFLGFVGDYALKTSAFQIADIIIEGLPDLLQMPPEPIGLNKALHAQIGEMLVKVDGKTIAHREVEVPEGMLA